MKLLVALFRRWFTDDGVADHPATASVIVGVVLVIVVVGLVLVAGVQGVTR